MIYSSTLATLLFYALNFIESPYLKSFVNFVSIPLTMTSLSKVINPWPYFDKSCALSTGIDFDHVKKCLMIALFML